MLITEEYRDLQREFHKVRSDYGTSSQKYVDQVLAMSQQIGSRDILDYGCGKAHLQKGFPFPIQNFDPCIDEYNRPPKPADIVVCTDVMEHIEPACIDAVIADLARLTKKILLVDVACRPAKKFLPDGRNAHLTIETPNWWLMRFLPHMDLHSFQAQQGMFTAIFFPLSAAQAASNDPQLLPDGARIV
jgi:hypothetical protein